MITKMKVKRIGFIAVLALVLIFVFAGISYADTGNAGVRSINHRGYSSKSPENTLPAFQLSAKMGYKYVETDIAFTKDGVPVLLHDSTINRMARNPDGSELKDKDVPIKDLTYDDALGYDFTGGMDGFKGTKIARADKFLDLCKSLGLHPYLELKDSGNYSRERVFKLVDLVRTKGMAGRVTWISFVPEFLQWVKEKDPHARLGILSIVIGKIGLETAIRKAESLRSGSNEVFLDVADICPSLTYDICKEKGMPLELWVSSGIPSVIKSKEKELLETLNPYVKGVTLNVYQYGVPDVILEKEQYTYDGKVKKPAVTAKFGGKTLSPGTTCKAVYVGSCTDVGTYTVKVSLIDTKYAGTGEATFRIRQAANPLTIKGKTANVSYAKLKEKSQKYAVTKVIEFRKKGVGDMAYMLVSVNNDKKLKKCFDINVKTGAVTVMKNTKAGVYKVKAKVKAKGNSNYRASDWKLVTFTIRVK